MKTQAQPCLGPLLVLLIASSASGQILYQDATSGPGGNTRLASGAEFNPPLNGVTGADDNWEQRTVFGASGNIFEAGGETAENAPELVTLLSGLTPGASYTVRVHFWDAAGTAPDWNVRAGFSPSPSLNPIFANPADAPDLGATAAVLASSLSYTTPPSVFVEADRTMFAGNVGIAIADALGQISVYIDDLPSAIGANNRTWYDGLSVEALADSDNDTLPDVWELANGLDPDDATGDNGPGGDPDDDGLTNFQEYAQWKTHPQIADTDGDGLLDGAEVNATLNDLTTPTGYAPTHPLVADSDNDGATDLEEVTGSRNIRFGNAPTDPNNADTDGDGLPDGYELTCNGSPATALNPNDNGSIDASQAPTADRDGDGLTNLEEYNPSLGPNPLSVQTRADLADTDGDGLSDRVEDNIGAWGGINLTGTNPTLADTDGDGLLDGEENFDLGSYQGAGVKPAWSDPNFADTDSDSFSDGFEVNTANTDPNSNLSVPVQPSGFTLVEDFEGSGMVIGQTFKGVNGWTSADDASGLIVADEPIAGGDKVGGFIRPVGGDNLLLYKSLSALGLQILEGNTGTLFLQIHASGPGLDHSLGLSDVANPVWFTDFEAQTALLGAERDLAVRAASGLRTYPGGGYRTGRWMNVWIVADNANDTVKVHVQSPDGETGVVDITPDAETNPYGFRNGLAGNALTTFQMIENAAAAPVIYIDNLYVDPTAANLTLPAAAKPEPAAAPAITSVFFAGPDLKIRFTPGGNGYVLTSSNDLASPFVLEPAATFDGVDTFTVPAAALNPGKDFFRVETP